MSKNIVETPKPPYYAVMFSTVMADVSPESITEYEEMASLMLKMASNKDGFLGFESARGEIGISISYWRDLEAIKEWKNNEVHKIAQRKGKTEWYSKFIVRVAKVEKEYGL